MKSSLIFSARVWIWVGVGLWMMGIMAWQTGQGEAATQNPIHPTFPLLDEEGVNVLESGKPVSTSQSCGGCHDVAFIEEHNFHADLGLSTFTDAGTLGTGRAWDSSLGAFGKWDPLTYRYLSPVGDEHLDLTTAEWVQQFGARHVGGGPALYGRDGQRLTEMPAQPGNPETTILNPTSGETELWDWQSSGVVEINCFLCHTPNPDNDARLAALQSGDFGWANSATLQTSGIITQAEGIWLWNKELFDSAGNLLPQALTLQDPTNANCGKCHGIVQTDANIPIQLQPYTLSGWTSWTTGQIISPERMVNSGINLADKESLTRSWDIHAERVLACTDCHYSLNNPIYYQEAGQEKPEHLIFDPRRLDFSDYLYRPLHQLAKGSSAQGTLAPEWDDSLRRCESCHQASITHNWLPYTEKHTATLSCESCHIPKVYAPAQQSVDWTVLQEDGSPVTHYRGIEGMIGDAADLVTGYEPVLLSRQNGDGSTSLAPYNLIASWYWVYGDPARPVPLRDLQAAWLAGEGYVPALLTLFDTNKDQQLDPQELLLDNEEKVTAIAQRLSDLGLENPRVAGEVQPYGIHHGVGHEGWATKKCQTCHGETSKVTAPINLAERLPAGVMPALVPNDTVVWSGELVQDSAGTLQYAPLTTESPFYLLGHHAIAWVDWVGAGLFLAVLGGASVHGGLRYVSARRQLPHPAHHHREYMYGVYERLWHWLQTVTILILLFTGLIIHKPDTFGIFSFPFVVQLHNIMAAILVINAALSAFYHLASGQIRQYLPRPYGFFDQAIVQANYYLRGIFRNDPHPFEKLPSRKLNPLQQMTYLAILNVLLPLQILSGALMWGAQRWQGLAESLGGLPFLAPFHTLVAWSFAAFIVLHVYLTTTGATPLAGIQSMILGWDEVETHSVIPPTPQAEPQPAELLLSTLPDGQ